MESPPNSPDRKPQGFTTRAIHHGYDPYAGFGSLIPPIHVSSTYAFRSAEDGGQRFAGEAPGYIYSRLANPTNSLLEARMAELEGGEAAVVTGSGMGAIGSLMWSMLSPGDEILTDMTLYGCTFALFHHAMEKFGVQVRHVDLLDGDALAGQISPVTKLLFFETPANPNMRVIDIEAVARAARGHGIKTVVDNTYMSPYLQRPIELGADLVVHSATKYLGGHGDLLAGVVVGSAEDIETIRYRGVKNMTGSCLSAFDGHLLLRGLKTLGIRMELHSDNAQVLAEFLACHPAVQHVYYPGLPGAPGHAVAKRQMRRFGGMIALELKGGMQIGLRFINSLKLFTRAVSLGDCESLVQHPTSMTHSTYTSDERRRHGITDGTIRLSVGLEDVEDLKEDLEAALDAIYAD